MGFDCALPTNQLYFRIVYDLGWQLGPAHINTASVKQWDGKLCPKGSRADLGLASEGWTGLNPSSLWFCCSHGANEQDAVGKAAEAGTGVNLDLPASGCPCTTEQTQVHRELCLQGSGEQREPERAPKPNRTRRHQRVLQQTQP